MNKNLSSLMKYTALLAASLALHFTSVAQTATFTNTAGGNWNTAANWDTGIIPGVLTNAIISNGSTVAYNAPMSSPTFGGLKLAASSVLNVNSSQFNVENGSTALPVEVSTGNSSATMNIANGGSMYVSNSGSMKISTNGVVSVSPGGSLIISNGLSTDSLLVGHNARYSSATFIANLFVGGTVTMSGRMTIAGSTSGGGAGSGSRVTVTNGGVLTCYGGSQINNTSDDGGQLMLVNGGTANLGTFTVARSTSSGGLIMSNGVINATGFRVGVGNSQAYSAIYGGALTNTGTFTVNDNTTVSSTSSDRRSRLLIRGGTVVGTDPLGIIVGNQSQAGAGSSTLFGGILDINAGLLIAEGITLLKDNSIINTYGTLNLSGSGIIYLGSVGLNGNTGAGSSGYFINLNGGTLAAKSSFAINGNAALGGAVTIQTADAGGTPYDITNNGNFTGSGPLIKTGNGLLVLMGTNTYSSATTINAGTLALVTNAAGFGGTLPNSSVAVASNAFFDVSQTAGFVMASAKTISGGGTVIGMFAAGPGAGITPAGNGAQGTLKFANGLSATNANFNLELSDDPTGVVKTNDFISITGDLNAGGTNNIIITPVTTLGVGTYKVLKFTGSFNGGITNFACTSGILTNPPGSGEINLIVAPARGPASLVWRGDGAANLWDTAGSSNWLNGVSRDRFYPGDTATLDDSATNFLVNLSGILSPASTGVVTINATNDYTLASGGDIAGPSGLTKTNSGKLTILAANDYTGITTIAGGILSVSNLANGGASSPIGAAINSSANIVFNGGTLEYLGANKNIDRGATILNGGGTLNVSNAGVTLTVSGGLTGIGTLTKIGNGQLTLTGGNSYSGGTVINAGTIRANPAVGLGTNLTLNGGATAATFQFAGDAQTLGIPLNVVGNNNFLTVGGNDTVNVLTGNGTVKVEGTGTQLLTFGAPDMSAFGGTIFWDTITTNRLFPNSGTSINAASTTFDLGSASGVLMNRDGGTYRLGALSSSSSTTELRGSNNSGSAATTYVIGEKNISTTFAGNIRTGTGGGGARTAIVKAGIGKLTLTGASTYTGFTTVSNGVLALGDGVTDGSISSTTNINVVAGAFLDVSGRTDGTLALGSAQTLRGNGTLLGTLDTSTGGTVSPGASIGTLTVTNSITLGGTALMEINRAGSPNSDKLVSSLSTITYGGTLQVVNIGAGLQVGDTFDLFDGAGLSGGTFSTILLPNYYTWDTTSFLGTDGRIFVTGVLPPPTITSIANDGVNVSIAANNGAPNGPYTLLTSTNAAAPLAGWTTVTTGTFDGAGEINPPITFPVDPAAEQQFYLLKVQ